MFNSSLDELYFSQLALAIYDKCALRFRRRYIDGLFWPQNWGGDTEQRELIEKGKLFHRLARRYYSRGEVLTEGVLSDDLKTWFERLREFRSFNEKDGFYPEYELRLNKDGVKLLAKFDLLYLDRSENRMIIYDWKTNKKPFPDRTDFEMLIQTKVYLNVLAEAGRQSFSLDKLTPASISLVYWNPRFPGDIKTVKYSQRKYHRDKQFLSDKIQEIKALAYDDFKAVNKDEICRYCEYRPICFGKKPELIELDEEDIELNLDWETIDEIQF